MLQDSPSAVQFVDKLIATKGFGENVNEEIRLQLRQDLLNELSDRLNRAIVESLSPEQVVKMEHLLDTNQIDKIQDFLYKEGINVQVLVARVMSEFQSSYLDED